MWFSPSLITFFVSMLISVFLVMTSPSILLAWFGLELNTLGFIPFILINKQNLTSEASIKYFLTQALASVLFLLVYLSEQAEWSLISSSLLTISMGIKLGAAPFHTWLPSVASSLSWEGIYLLLTLQKINPLLILWNFSIYSSLFMILIVFSLLVGAFQGLVQTSTRLILTFSSINHLGWMLTTSIYDLNLMIMYFCMYMILLLPVVMIMSYNNITHINQLSSLHLPLYLQPLIFLNLLSLGGLPPFLGFLPKWIILQNMISSGLYLICMLMVMTSLITLYFYLRITFSAFIMSNNKIILNLNKNSFNLCILSFSFISLMGLTLTFMI